MRVWPFLVGAALVAGTAIAAVPAVRAQAQLSFTREAPGFVELFAVPLDPAGNVGTTCQQGPRGPGTTEMDVSVTSHEAGPTTVRLAFGAETRRGPVGRGTTKEVRLEPGETKSRRVDVAVPTAGPFDVRVDLVGTDQHLLVHCGSTP